MAQEKENTVKQDEKKRANQMPPNEKGTGLYSLAEAIGGQGGHVIGDDNPGREENVSGNDEELKTPEWFFSIHYW